MTDGERANEIVRGWLGIKVRTSGPGSGCGYAYLDGGAVVAAAEAIVAALAAVRAEERAECLKAVEDFARGAAFANEQAGGHPLDPRECGECVADAIADAIRWRGQASER